ncbi:hypothetical protein [Streptosporangium longisporum]
MNGLDRTRVSGPCRRRAGDPAEGRPGTAASGAGTAGRSAGEGR